MMIVKKKKKSNESMKHYKTESILNSWWHYSMRAGRIHYKIIGCNSKLNYEINLNKYEYNKANTK